MIFVPEKEKCDLWNEYPDDFIYIIYNYSEDIQIHFRWWKENEANNELKTYKLNLEEIVFKSDDLGNKDYIPIIGCVENACRCQPELRFNKILNKWFCGCKSSFICTADDDEDELEHPQIKLHIKNNQVNEEHGYFDNPIKAILHHNKAMIDAFIENQEMCKNILKNK